MEEQLGRIETHLSSVLIQVLPKKEEIYVLFMFKYEVVIVEWKSVMMVDCPLILSLSVTFLQHLIEK